WTGRHWYGRCMRGGRATASCTSARCAARSSPSGGAACPPSRRKPGEEENKMKRLAGLWGLVPPWGLCEGRGGGAQKPGEREGRALRVLILSGVPETHHDYKNQCPNMEKALQKQGHKVSLRDKAVVERMDAADFDVLVLMSEKWRGDEANRKEMLRLVREGKGLVVIHMAYVPCVEAL